MSKPLKWKRHADLAIKKTPTVFREEYLNYMTFQRNDRPLFTEAFGPIVGLKEEWEEQGATPEELDFSAFRYRCEAPRGAGLAGSSALLAAVCGALMKGGGRVLSKERFLWLLRDLDGDRRESGVSP